MKVQWLIGWIWVSLLGSMAEASFYSVRSCESQSCSENCVPKGEKIRSVETSASRVRKTTGDLGCWNSKRTSDQLCFSNLNFDEVYGLVDVQIQRTSSSTDEVEIKRLRLMAISFVHNSDYISVVAAGKFGKEDVISPDGYAYEFNSKITLVLLADKQGSVLRIESVKIDHGTYTENFSIQ